MQNSRWHPLLPSPGRKSEHSHTEDPLSAACFTLVLGPGKGLTLEFLQVIDSVNEILFHIYFY